MSELLDGIVVVLVEDEPDALALFMAMMMYRGAVVVPAPDAKEALDALSRIRPHVLVSDMHMPERDGAWLLTEARRQGLLNGVPTLVVTALGMTPQEVQEVGFDAYLRKPIDPTVLCNTVQSLARAGAQPSA